MADHPYWDLFSPVDVPEMKLPGQQMTSNDNQPPTGGIKEVTHPPTLMRQPANGNKPIDPSFKDFMEKNFPKTSMVGQQVAGGPGSGKIGGDKIMQYESIYDKPKSSKPLEVAPKGFKLDEQGNYTREKESDLGGMQLAGDVVSFPGYPGDEMSRRLQILDLKERIIKDNPKASADSINKAFDDYFGGPAKILHMDPG